MPAIPRVASSRATATTGDPAEIRASQKQMNLFVTPEPLGELAAPTVSQGEHNLNALHRDLIFDRPKRDRQTAAA
ncbi:hypothetical protein [Acetobacter sp. DsW_063]|uniref:hypothetical protein n=1 Tax=Acetobacter sp. DsW_063 TaxID=1514894 RepID=UPI000A3ACA2C|nr:hypothetical protein [Acetobacter sp. DsW_063]OUJ13990.1 hypothetical protein HK28_00985 [Acetobacter sp. DsW_063]